MLLLRSHRFHGLVKSSNRLPELQKASIMLQLKTLEKNVSWIKTIHYPKEIRSYLVTIVPMAPFTTKSTSKLRFALL